MSELLSSDIQYAGMCLNLIKFKDRYQRLNIAKYNIPLEDISLDTKDGVILYINCLIYRCIEEFLGNMSLSRSSIGTKYDMAIRKKIGVDYMEFALRGWVFCNKVFDTIESLMIENDEIYPNVHYHKRSYRPSNSYSLKIDALFREKKSPFVKLLSVVPHNPRHLTLSGISSVDTVMAIDFLIEAEMPMSDILEIEYDINGEYLTVNKINMTQNIARYVKRSVECMNNNRVNLNMCNNCAYSLECRLRNRI